MMNRIFSTLGGAGLAALAMYMLDPQQGKRRRAGARDQMQRATNSMRKAADAGSRDLARRSRGLLVSLRNLMPSQKLPVSDDVLASRVRSKVGHVVSHSGAIETEVYGNKVILSGPILRHEVPLLMARVWAIPGVQEVESRLEAHDQPGSIPELQGEGRPLQRRLLQRTTTPAARMVTGAAGLGVGLWGYSSDSWLSRYSLLGVGAGLLAYALAANRQAPMESGLLRPSDLMDADRDAPEDEDRSPHATEQPTAALLQPPALGAGPSAGYNGV